MLHKRKDDLLFCNPGPLILAYRLAGRPGHEIVAGNFTRLLYASEQSSGAVVPVFPSDFHWLSVAGTSALWSSDRDQKCLSD